MAPLRFEFFKVGLFWWYRFRLDGVRIKRSTREKDRAKALRVAQDAFDAALLRSRGEEPEPTMGQLVKLWVKAHRLTHSAAHLAAVERFGRLHIASLRGLKVSECTTQRVGLALNAYLTDHELSSGNQWLAYLRVLTRWAISCRMIRTMPWALKKLKVKRKPKRLLPLGRAGAWIDQVERIAQGEPALPMAVRLMAGLGLRESEAVKARWEWLDWERGGYTPGDTKGGEAMTRPVPEWLLAHLWPIRKPQGLIVAARGGRLLTWGKIQRVLDAACTALSIPRLTAHRLRGTYATLLAEEGVPIVDIQRAMGHKDVRTTMGYLEHDMGRVAAAQARIAQKAGFTGPKVAHPTTETRQESEK